jgi:hypothetical protein
MHALTSMHGWGWLLVIFAIFGWSALMLLAVFVLTKLWRPPSRMQVAAARRPATGRQPGVPGWRSRLSR